MIAFLPASLGYFFGPMLGSQLVKAQLFYIFPAAFAFTLLGIIVLAWARSQPPPAAQAEGETQPRSAAAAE